MNIWLVNHYAVAPNEAGGTRHFSLARELIDCGHSVTIVAASVNYLTRTEERLNAHERIRLEVRDGVPFLHLRGLSYRSNSLVRVFGMISFALGVWRIRKLPELSRPELVIGSSPHTFAALAAERIAHAFRVPFVLEVRDLWPQTLVELGNMSRLHPLVFVFGTVERFLYRRARRIVTLLPEASQHMTRKGANPAKVVWIPNGFDARLLPEPPALDAPRNAFTVMYAGAHGIANSLDTVLDAVGYLKGIGMSHRVCFRFIGDGREKPRLMRRAQEEHLENVSFEGPVAKTVVYSLMAEADAFIACLRSSPLYESGISLNKLFDYLYMGRPIVFSAGLTYNPVAEAGAGITVAPEDGRALAEGIQQLMEMPLEERRAMGRRGQEYVRARHDMHELGQRLLRVLAEAVDEDERSDQTA